MINEGVVVNDTKTQIKTKMLEFLWKEGRTTPDAWEKQTFYELTGHHKEDIDWSIEDNQAGYYSWVKSFDGLIQELVDDGYVVEEQNDGEKVLVPTDIDQALTPAQQTKP